MKLFIVVRDDLMPGLQIAQACHAKELYSQEHPELNQSWYEESNNIVVLSVPNKDELLDVGCLVASKKIALSVFQEPDLGDDPTALACSGDAACLLSSLPLALRPARAA